MQDALNLEKLRVVLTGGTADDSERTQWDSGANLVCISPRAVVAYDSDTQYQHEAAHEGIEAVTTAGAELGRGYCRRVSLVILEVELEVFISSFIANKVGVSWKLYLQLQAVNDVMPTCPDTASRGRLLAMALVMLMQLLLPTIAAAQEPVWRYTVRPGDNIWDLSRRYLANWRNWTQIQELNGIVQPRRIPPGTRLSIPLRLLRLETASAILVEASGDLTLLRAGDAIGVAEGDTLELGDKLLTSEQSSAVIRFADGSEVVMGSEAELLLDRLNQYRGTGMVDTRLRLERGRLETVVQPARGDGSHFEIWTPPAVSSVRGTDLRVGLDATATQSATEVLTGTVAVAANATARRVPAGFGTITQAGEPPEPPRPLLPAPELETLPQRLERLPLRLPMPELPGAASFRLTLALDESFTPPLLDEIVDAGQSARLELPDGVYAARLRGIEADGLEGLDRDWELEIFARPAPPVPIRPEREGRLRDPLPQFGWSEPLDAESYRFELSTDPDFAAPPVAEETLTEVAFRPASPLPVGSYFWRLATIDATGRQGPFGDVQDFEVLEPPPDPTIDDLESERGQVRIRLTELAPGQQVRFQIARDSGFEELLSEQTSDEPVLTVPGLLPGDYWFRAQIIEADGYVSEFSTPQRITVPAVSWWPWLLLPFALAFLLI